MAESQTPAAAPAATTTTKPVKPDQDAYNEKLAKAEKEYQDALKQYVSPLPWPLLPGTVESERDTHHGNGSRITGHDAPFRPKIPATTPPPRGLLPPIAM